MFPFRLGGGPLLVVVPRLLRLLSLVRPYWTNLAFTIALGILLGAVGIATPLLTRQFIDVVYPNKDIVLLNLLVAALFGVGIASAVLSTLSFFFGQYVMAQLVNSTNVVLFDHLQRLPLRFFSTHRVGDLNLRFDELQASLGGLSQALKVLCYQGFFVVLIPPVLFWLEWRLAIVALLLLPIPVFLATFAAEPLRRRWKLNAETRAELAGYRSEIFSSILQVKCLAMEGEAHETFQEQSSSVLASHVQAATLTSMVNGATSLLYGLTATAMAFVGWNLAVGGELTLGTLVAFTAYLTLLTGPLHSVTAFLSSVPHLVVKLERVFELLDRTPEEELPSQEAAARLDMSPIAAPPLIEIRHVCFEYDGGKAVLDDVSVVLRPGTVTAIVGPSGAGKSTLLRIIGRLEEPSAGRVEIDGRCISTFSLRDYRRSIGMVPQDVSLFRGTVWSNLTVGCRDIDQDKVPWAMRACGLEEWVSGLPEGYGTRVSEWGASLSGGQRQRIGLARALIRSAPVLLLDEVTSSVDAATEHRILQALLSLGKHATIVVVSHRSTVARLADSVLIMAGGRVVAVGTHAALHTECPYYGQLMRQEESNVADVELASSDQLDL